MSEVPVGRGGCDDPSCPSCRLYEALEKLHRMGIDPQEAICGVVEMIEEIWDINCTTRVTEIDDEETLH